MDCFLKFMFANGWLQFVKESGSKAGDTVILFDSLIKGRNFTNAVICKGQDELVRSTHGIEKQP